MKALNMLRTVKGQLEGIIRMVEEDAYCVDVSRQILSAQAILKKANTVILRQHMDTCVRTALSRGGDEAEDKLQEIGTILESYLG